MHVKVCELMVSSHPSAPTLGPKSCGPTVSLPPCVCLPTCVRGETQWGTHCLCCCEAGSTVEYRADRKDAGGHVRQGRTERALERTAEEEHLPSWEGGQERPARPGAW